MREPFLAAAVYLMACVTTVVGQSQPSQSPNEQKTDKQPPAATCPMRDTHSRMAHSRMDHSHMNDRGEKGMGFSPATTTHHFFLTSDGGAIQVGANDPTDTASRNNIRMHLGHIAHAFQSGDFDIPMFVHDTVPPGVREMKSLQKSIRYSFEETPTAAAWSSPRRTKVLSTPSTDSCASRSKSTKRATLPRFDRGLTKRTRAKRLARLLAATNETQPPGEGG